MTYVMGWSLKHLRWIPHKLTDEQKQRRVEKSNELLILLRSVFHQSMDYVVTLDESWFYLSTDYEQIWLPRGIDPPERERKMISSKKVMITIAWRPSGILLIKMLPKGRKFNSQYMIEEILTPLSEMLADVGNRGSRKYVIHMDNAKPHNAQTVQKFFEVHRLRRAPQPVFSPDVAPTDFFLFGCIKGRLEGQSFDSEETLLDVIEEIAHSIPPDVLRKTYSNWLERLEAVIASGCNYN